MANYATLIAAVQNVIKTNANNEITGAILQQTLLSIIGSLGAQYQFIGVALPSTNPGTPDQNVAYIAGPGTYPNFGPTTVADNQIAIFKYNGSWTYQLLTINESLFVNKADANPGKNFFDVSKSVPGYFIDTNGGIRANANYTLSAYCPVEPSTAYYLSAANNASIASASIGICFYDENFTFLSAIAGNNKSFTTPAGTKYIRFAFASTLTEIQLEKGAARTDYEAYNPIGGYLDSVGYNQLQQDVREKVDILPGINLFDISKKTAGKYLSTSGAINNNASYCCSDYCPVEPSTDYYLSAAGNVGVGSTGAAICFYDESLAFISGIASNTRNFTTPSNAAYLRFSYYVTGRDDIQLEKGTTRSAYQSFNPIGGYLNISENEIKDNAITKSKLGTWAISKGKTQFFRINLFNPNDPDYKPGYYLNNNGNESANANYAITGYIPFNKDMGKLVASINGKRAIGSGNMVLYDASKNIIAIVSMVSNNIATWQAGVAYVRFSLMGYAAGNIQVEVGEEIGPYLPYGKYEWASDIPLPNQLGGLLGRDAGRITGASLANGESLTITTFPYYIKKGQCLSFEAQISSFSKIRIGRGYAAYRGAWFEVDGTNIIYVFQTDASTQTVMATVPHGLSIGTFIKISIYNNDAGDLSFVLQSIGGYFEHTFEGFGFEMNHEAFILSVGSTLTALKFNATDTDLRCPVWMFGDSYFGVYNIRWPYYLKEFGFWNFMIDGYAGIGSASMYPELLRCLQFGTPKYLVWCLGMNDSDASFQEYFNYVCGLCDALGITLIGATIPSVPDRSKETISNVVKNSGRRYIDFYKAVGANSSGTWYPGYLSSDNVHPDALGAQALATQVLTDFPEIMQYK